MRAITAGITPIAWITPSRAAVAGRLRRIRLESARVAAVAPRTRLSSNGMRAERIRLRTSGSTSIDSASLIGPRRPGALATRPGTSSGLRSEATSIEPSGRRTAAAQWVGPWTSRPLRRAMPPSRSFFAFGFASSPAAIARRYEMRGGGRVEQTERAPSQGTPAPSPPCSFPGRKPPVRASGRCYGSPWQNWKAAHRKPGAGEKLRCCSGLAEALAELGEALAEGLLAAVAGRLVEVAAGEGVGEVLLRRRRCPGGRGRTGSPGRGRAPGRPGSGRRAGSRAGSGRRAGGPRRGRRRSPSSPRSTSAPARGRSPPGARFSAHSGRPTRSTARAAASATSSAIGSALPMSSEARMTMRRAMKRGSSPPSSITAR